MSDLRYWEGDVGGSRRLHPPALHRRASPRSDSASLMRAAGISEFGGAVGRIDLPDPRPLADDEVLIEIRAAGVGNWEEFVRTGQWDIGRAPPMALGVEAAGTITAIGDSVEDWEPGDEVLSHPLPLRDQGTWAPLLIASATVLARKPAPLSWEAASAFPVPALTATQVIDGALAVRPDDLVLVNGGSGTTGTQLVGLAAARGAEVIATAGPASHERLRRRGARPRAPATQGASRPGGAAPPHDVPRPRRAGAAARHWRRVGRHRRRER